MVSPLCISTKFTKYLWKYQVIDLPLAVQHWICWSALFILQTMPPHDVFPGWYGSNSILIPFGDCSPSSLFVCSWCHSMKLRCVYTLWMLIIWHCILFPFCFVFVPYNHLNGGSECDSIRLKWQLYSMVLDNYTLKITMTVDLYTFLHHNQFGGTQHRLILFVSKYQVLRCLDGMKLIFH